MEDISVYAKKILDYVKEIEIYKNYKQSLLKQLTNLESQYKKGFLTVEKYEFLLNKILNNRPREEVVIAYNDYINKLILEIKQQNSNIYEIIQIKEFEDIPVKVSEKNKDIISLLKKQVDKESISIKQITKEELLSPLIKETKKEYLKNLNITEEDLRNFIEYQRKKSVTKKTPIDIELYSVYKSNLYSKIANTYMENLTIKLTRKFPNFFQLLYKSLRLADIRLLSKTYVSIMLFSTLLAFPLVALIAFILTFSLIQAIIFGILGMIFTFVFIYFYPTSLIRTINKGIKSDLVFAVVHMAAIAGSGTKPIKIFNLLLESKEYKYLETEIKKIINYINLFGYNLSTALKTVAATTPSYELKELLNGMVTTIETGGDIKQYLKDKSDDTLTTYRLDQQKYVETLATFSEVYTGVLIAAPLLFIVTLAILDTISGSLGGININTIALIGIFGLLPFVNIVFLLFLNITQPEI